MWNSITCFLFFIVKAEIILYFREISNIRIYLAQSGWVMVPAPEPVNDKAKVHCKLLKTPQH